MSVSLEESTALISIALVRTMLQVISYVVGRRSKIDFSVCSCLYLNLFYSYRIIRRLVIWEIGMCIPLLVYVF